MHPGVLGLFPQNRARKSTDHFFGSNHELGEDWYRSHFHTERYRDRLRRELGYRPVSGEASPFYAWDPRIAGRAYQSAPRVKAIMLLRNPVKRAWSHYQERTQNGVEPLDFAHALACEPTRLEGELERMASDELYHSDAYDWYSYRSRGDYLPQILNWTSVFRASSCWWCVAKTCTPMFKASSIESAHSWTCHPIRCRRIAPSTLLRRAWRCHRTQPRIWRTTSPRGCVSSRRTSTSR